MEIWKSIKGYEGIYEVSNLGNVKSLERYVNCTHYEGKIIKEKILKPQITKKGYLTVRNLSIHRLVAIAFIPNIYNKPQINHINGIKTDNRVENLEWCNNSENQKHAFKNGLQDNKGIRHPSSFMNEENVLAIRKLYKTISNVAIANIYNIKKEHVSMICRRKIWKHI